MSDKNIERILKCLRGDVKEELINIIDESNLPEKKKESLKSQIEDIKSCRGKPLDLEDVESISSLSEVLDGNIYILGQDNCPECKVLKERLRENGKVEFVDLHSAEGERVAGELSIKTVPSAYTYKGGELVACEFFSDEENVLVTCDGETIDLT